jgi:hypothetical protein
MKQYLRVPCHLVFLVISLFVCVFPFSLATPAFAQPTNSAQVASQGSKAQTCAQPPQNVDLMTLSDAQLRQYGFPVHAVLDRNPAQWSAVLAHAKHRACTSSSDASTSAEPLVGVPPPYSPAWGGYEATGGRGVYRQAFVTFTVPTVHSESSSANSQVGLWAGVGGDQYFAGQYYELVQAGVIITVTPGGVQTNEPFWEHYGTTAINLPQNFGFTIHTGDSVSVEVDSNLQEDGYNYYYVGDNTRGSYNTYTESGNFSDSATGECIGEKTSAYVLANFGTEHLNDCIMGDDTETGGIGAWGVSPRILTTTGDSSGAKEICLGSIVNNDLFSLYWKNKTASC